MLGVQNLTDGEFKKFSDLIYKHVGIFLKTEKKELLNARLGKRLRACGISTYREYLDFILRPDQQESEFVLFLDSVSTNFTSFFREGSHFDFLKGKVLPELLTQKGAGREFFFWSSASSSGEEPYTMAMILNDYAEINSGFRYKVLATDISTKVLGMAARGVYSTDQITKMPNEFLKKYFQRGVGTSAGKVKIKQDVRSKVTFERFNLMHDFPWREEMDVIFCRNVMIYFDQQTQAKLVNKFYDCLKKGGYLFIGHSESIASIKHKFVQVEATTYKKQ